MRAACFSGSTAVAGPRPLPFAIGSSAVLAAPAAALRPSLAQGQLPAFPCSPSNSQAAFSGRGSSVTPASTSRGAAAGGAAPMRRLILLRHAESETTGKVRDHDRSISEIGKQQALAIAHKLKEAGWGNVDLIMASNSKRTKQTIDTMAEAIPELGDVDAHYYGSLYTVAALDGQTQQHLSECILELADDAKTSIVMCVGHNKGWEEAASAFAGKVVKLKTASAALLQCAASSWHEALAENSSAQWQLVAVCTPQQEQ